MIKDHENIQNGEPTEPIPREPTQEEYRAFYDNALETLKDVGLRPTSYNDAQEDPAEPAELYHVKLDDLEAGEDSQLSHVFRVPREIAEQHPRDYFLSLATPYRLEGNPTDDPKQVAIHASYVYGDNEASVSFSVWGTQRPDGSKFWQGDYTMETEHVDSNSIVEEERRSMTIDDLHLLEAVVAYSEHGLK